LWFRFELHVEALQRAAHSRRATTDDDDIVVLFATHLATSVRRSSDVLLTPPGHV